MICLRDVIVVGATGSGLDAVSAVVGALKPDIGAIVFVALQRSPVRPGRAADMLTRSSDLQVSYGRQKEAVQPGHIYLSPPDRHLTISSQRTIFLDRGSGRRFGGPSADPLFRSAAGAYGARVVGVVLGGHQGDGLEGCLAIKAAGGVVIVQDPREAKLPEMPESVLCGMEPDYCSTANAISEIISNICGAAG